MDWAAKPTMPVSSSAGWTWHAIAAHLLRLLKLDDGVLPSLAQWSRSRESGSDELGAVTG